MTTAIASSGGRCRSVVLTERYARPPRVARTHHRRSHSKLSETQFREGFSAPRYPPNVPPDHPTLDLRPERGSPPPHPTLDLGRQRRWGGGGTMVPWGGGPWAIGRYGRRNVERAEEMGAVVCSSQGVVVVPCRAFNGAHSLTH
jgi:hypothetical protein